MTKLVFAEAIIDELRGTLSRHDLQRIVTAAQVTIEEGEAPSAEITYSAVPDLSDVPCRQMWLRQGEHEQNIGLLTVYTTVFQDELVILFAKEGHLMGIKERNRVREVYRIECARRQP